MVPARRRLVASVLTFATLVSLTVAGLPAGVASGVVPPPGPVGTSPVGPPSGDVPVPVVDPSPGSGAGEGPSLPPPAIKQPGPRPPYQVTGVVQPISSKPRSTPLVRGFDPRYSHVVDKDTTPTREFYQNADGSGTAVFSPNPVRFKAADGSWRTIDLSLISEADGSLRPRSAQQISRIGVDGGLPALSLPTSAGVIEVQHTGLAVDLANRLLSTPPVGAPAGSAAALAVVHGPAARLAVAGGVDVDYQMLPNGVRDDLVLSSASAGSAFTVTMTLPRGVSARQSGKSVQFVDAAGGVLFTYSGGVAYDAVAAAKGDAAPAATVTPVTVSLVSHGIGAAVVRVSVDSGWLSASARVFPVVIDPTEQYSGTTEYNDTYVSSDNPNSTIVSGGIYRGTAYVDLPVLRLGDAAALGTARILLLLDAFQSYTPDANYEFTPSDTATLSMYASTGASCGQNAGVDVITDLWDPYSVTWATQPAAISSPPDGWQVPNPVNTYTNFNVSTAIAGFYNHQPWHGLEVRQQVESNAAVDCWRGFDSENSTGNEPYLTVNYDYVAPTAPGGTSGDNGSVWSQSTLDDPVDVVTGNLKDPFTDLASPAGVYGLDWTRTYNLYDSEHPVSPGGLGLGWSSALYPSVQTVTGGVQLTAPDGRKVTWPSSGSGFTRPFEYPADLSVVNGNYRISFDGGSYWDFDSLGRLAKMTASNGQSVSINRNSSGQLTTAQSSTGAQLSFLYGSSGYGSGRIVSVTGPAGTVSYGYDSYGDLTSATDTGGHVTKYGYDSSERLTSITDPSGVVQISNTFDGSGRVASQKHPSGGTTSFVYGTYDSTSGLWTTVVTDTVTQASGTVTFYWNSAHEVLQVKDNLPNPAGGTGNTMVEDFGDTLGDLTSVTSRIGGNDKLYYDSANHLLCDQQPGAVCPAAGAGLSAGTGAYTAYSYDSLARVTAKYVAGSGTTSYTYSGSDRLPTTMTDAAGDVTRYVITGGLVTQQTDPDGVVTGYTYDSAGRMLSKTVGGNTTSYTYDSAGRRTCQAQPGGTCPDASGAGGSGSYTTTTYNTAGLVKSTRAADGGITSYTYDAAGRQLTSTDPTGAVTTNHYDPATGLLLSVDKPGQIVGGAQQYVTTHYAYDANGNQTCTAPPGGTCPTASGTGGVEPYQLTSYGALGRVTSTTNELGQVTSFKYDADGNKIETDNPDGSVVKAAYDAAGRLYCTTAPGAAATVNCPNLSGSGGLGRYTITAYDPFGRVSCVAQPGGSCGAGAGPITTYTFDSLGRQHTVTDVNGGTATTTYTNAGHKYQVTDPDSGVTTYTYDGAGRPSQVTDPDGGATTTTYTPQSWVASTTDPTGLVTSYAYDAAGRQATITGPDGVVTTRTYTLRGELKTQKVGTDGVVSYTYNGDGTVASVIDPLGNTTAYSYDARGNRSARTDAAGKTQTSAYDNADELVSQADQLNRATTTSYYEDTTNGHKTVIADPSGRTTTTKYNPDGTPASTTATDSAGSLTYTYSYDNLAHPISIVAPDGTWSYGFNAAGELTSETTPGSSTTAWSYDQAGRRTTMTYPDGTQIGYGYDKAGRLTQETLTPKGASTTQLAASYTYDGDGHLLTATLPDGSRSYTYGTTGSAKGKITTYSQALPGAGISASLAYDANGRLHSVTSGGTASVAPKVAAGYLSSLALKSDGTVWSWGWDGYGQLGDNSGPNTSIPVQVGGLDQITAIAAGEYHSLALRSDGTVWAWGDNGYGELGDGTTTPHSMPRQVPNLNGVVAIAAGYDLSVALKSDGTVWAWGYNNDGELGNSTTTASSVPVKVSGLTGVSRIGSAMYNVLAVTSGGAVWAWGYNGEGALGNGTTTSSSVPVQVKNLTGITSVGGGYRYSVALKSDGTVWAWGHNYDGELGNGTTTNSSVPVQVKNLTGVTAVSGGLYTTIAAKADGTVWAWGYNAYGELGNGTTTTSSLPVQTASLANPTAVSAGYFQELALMPDGSSRGWGYNGNGEVGNGTTTSTYLTPTAGLLHTTRKVTSYGYDAAGQLITQTDSDGLTTTYTYDNLGHRATATAGGQVTTYRYDDAGELCWTITATSTNTNSCTSPPAGATTYSYDAAGRRLTETNDSTHKTTSTYDPAGRLQTLEVVSGSADTTQTRGYDPAGNLATTTDTGSDTYAFTYTWDTAARIPTIAAESINGSTPHDRIYGAGQWAGYFGGGSVIGIGLDALGDVIPTAPTLGLASDDGYTAWGTRASNPGEGLLPYLGYRGELQIGNTLDLRARNYDTTSGAFTTVDPLDGANGTTTIAALYPYADNNPVNNVDPTGQAATDWNAFAAAWNAARTASGLDPAGRSTTDCGYYGSNWCGGSTPGTVFNDSQEVSLTGEYPTLNANVQYQLTVDTSVTIQGNLHGVYFSLSNKEFGMSYTDSQGNAVSISQEWYPSAEYSSVRATVNGASFKLGSWDIKFAGSIGGDGSVELDAYMQHNYDLDGQELELENAISLELTYEPLPTPQPIIPIIPPIPWPFPVPVFA